MRNVVELQAAYEDGIYTFGEVVTALICEGASRSPAELAADISAEFLKGVADSSCSLPLTATAKDVVVFKSSREHAEEWFNGAVHWRRYFTDHRKLTVDCAAASDGGSLLLEITKVGELSRYVVNRSIASRGTDQYDNVSGPEGDLSVEERRHLLAELEELYVEIGRAHPCASTVAEFIEVLK